MTTGLAILFVVGPVVLVPMWLWLLPAPEQRPAARMLAWTRRAALPAGLVLAIAFLLPAGPLAGALAVPWLGFASLGVFAALLDAIAGLRDGRAWHPGTHHARWAAMAFLAVGAGNALADRLGVQPFGFDATTVLLTAIHFTYAGFILVLAGATVHDRRPRHWTEGALALLVVGIPVTAVGFFGVPLAAWLGAVLVAAGGIGIGTATIAARGAVRPGAARRLVTIAGTALLVSMPLAIAFATGTWLGTTWLDIPTMARTHGVINVLVFALPVTIAWTLDRRAGR